MEFIIYQSTQNEQWYWRLKAANNKIVADSGEGYHNKDDCLHGIGLVMDSDRNTPIKQG